MFMKFNLNQNERLIFFTFTNEENVKLVLGIAGLRDDFFVIFLIPQNAQNFVELEFLCSQRTFFGNLFIIFH